MALIFFYKKAEQRLLEIKDWYTNHRSVSTATKFVQNVEQGMRTLAAQPHIGTWLSIERNTTKEYRSLVIHQHIRIIYYIEQENLYVVDIWDTRKDNEQVLKKTEKR